jgi:hypothetical protein
MGISFSMMMVICATIFLKEDLVLSKKESCGFKEIPIRLVLRRGLDMANEN